METSAGIRLHNWLGDVVSDPRIVVRPRNVDDIVAVMKDPARFPSPVRAIGSNHSTTRCAVADGGTVIEMKSMKRILEIGADTVTVQAGAMYLDVAKELEKRGLQFFVNVELGSLTMGSAACGGTKDASLPGEFGQVNAYAIGIKLVTPSGELVHATEDDPELLQAVRSSYGLFGVVYEVTFRVRKLRLMTVEHESYSLEEFLRRLPELVARGQSMMLYIFPFLDGVSVEFRKYHEGDARPHRLLWRFRNEVWKSVAPGLGYLANRYLPAKARDVAVDHFNQKMRLIVHFLMRDKDTVATDQIIKYPEKSGWTRYTFSIWAFPEAGYPKVLREYFQFCKDHYKRTGYRCNVLNVGYRIAKDRNSLLSYSWDGDVITVDPVSTGGEGWDDFLRAYNAFCSERDGVPLFNQTKWILPGQAKRAFGDRLVKLNEYRKRFDPNDRMLNKYFAEMLG
jgi:FAD/FMN-containing dehydrogenase